MRHDAPPEARDRANPPDRPAFSPARLVLGLALLGIALLYVMRALGHWELPLTTLFPLLPGALLLAGGVAGVTRAVRRRGRRRGPL